MEFWSSVQVIIRRWYVVVICGVLASLLAVVIIHQVKPTYQASGKLTILQTGQPTSPSSAENNPWGAANVFTAAVVDAAGAQSFQDQLVARGASPIYSVAPSINNTPTLVISTTANTPSGATSSFGTLTKLLQQKIQSMQASVNTPKSTLYSGVVLTAPTQPTQLVGSRIKALILLGVVGLIVTLGLVFLVDAVIQAGASVGGRSRRSRRRSPRSSVSTRSSPWTRRSALRTRPAARPIWPRGAGGSRRSSAGARPPARDLGGRPP